ncbi:MAG: primosomal protein N', partial [Chloroflexota bacterium]
LEIPSRILTGARSHSGDRMFARLERNLSRQQNNPETCPVCNSSRIRYFGLGTERVEAALRRTFPEAKPLRFDQDTTRKSGSHYTFLQHFVEGRANVMIGTQMVAKGLDLPLVTLVGVISADTALYLPDFRSAERTFQVLMQVAGRAGRSPLGGRVIVQTYTPDHPAIIAASEHDYEGFYNEELYFRYEQGYPPFKRLARLRYSGSGYQQSRQAAQDLVDKLKLWVDQQGFPAVEIIGPTPTYVQRLRAKFRWQIIIHAPDPAEVIGPVPLPIGWQVDIDPVNLL